MYQEFTEGIFHTWRFSFWFQIVLFLCLFFIWCICNEKNDIYWSVCWSLSDRKSEIVAWYMIIRGGMVRSLPGVGLSESWLVTLAVSMALLFSSLWLPPICSCSLRRARFSFLILRNNMAAEIDLITKIRPFNSYDIYQLLDFQLDNCIDVLHVSVTFAFVFLCELLLQAFPHLLFPE